MNLLGLPALMLKLLIMLFRTYLKRKFAFIYVGEIMRVLMFVIFQCQKCLIRLWPLKRDMYCLKHLTQDMAMNGQCLKIARQTYQMIKYSCQALWIPLQTL